MIFEDDLPSQKAHLDHKDKDNPKPGTDFAPFFLQIRRGMEGTQQGLHQGQVYIRAKPLEFLRFIPLHCLNTFWKRNLAKEWIVQAVGRIVLCIGIRQDSIASIRYIDPVNGGR
jgi:hypothetical protein